MPAGRVSSVKYAGNCKTTTLEPVHARENSTDKTLSVLQTIEDSLFLCAYLTKSEQETIKR